MAEQGGEWPSGDRAWLQATLASIGDGVIATDASGKVTFVNPAAQALTGWAPEEALGQPLEQVFRIINEHDRQPVENPVARLLRDQTAIGLANHTVLVARDGTERPIDDSAAPIQDRAGIVGVVLVFRDITQRREAERAVQDARTYAEGIVATVRESLLVLDGKLRVLSANRSFYQTFRAEPAETEGRLVYDLGNRQWDIPALRTLLNEILPRNTVVTDFAVDHAFPAIGRKIMRLNARKLRRAGEHAEAILLAIEDVTLLRQTEEARREAETQFTALVKNVRDHSIFTTDVLGNVASWNIAAQAIMGYTEAEALGRPIAFIFTPEDIQNHVWERELQQANEEGRAEDERWHVRKDGTRFWALGLVTPIHDAGGKLTGFCKILRDMTDRKRAEEALREADRRKDEFLAMLSHELRNPLAPVRNALHILRVRGLDETTVDRAREMMDRQVEHLVRLVDDLLDVSRIMRDKIVLRKEPVQVATVVARAVETAQPIIDAQGHELNVALPPEPLLVEGDLIRLSQVLSNLLTNAAKYTEKAGRIWLTAERDGDQVVIRVRDNGMGILPEMLPQVFDLFMQANSLLDRSQGGLGIGLTLVKRLVEMHNGSVTAFSEGPGKGSTFTIRLLLVRPAGHPGPRPGEERGQANPQLRAMRRHRILVVDDNVDAAESLAMMLRMWHHDVLTVHDGPEALAVASSYRPEIVILDIGLPGMSGYEVARQLRERPDFADVLLVAMTGYGQDEDRRRSQDAGFDHHLTKPANPDDLQKLIASLSSARNDEVR